MSKARILISILFMISFSKSFSTLQSKRSKETVASMTQTGMIKQLSSAIGSTFADLVLNHFMPKNSFGIVIVNNMRNRRLIDPKMFLENGQTFTPPPFMISAVREASLGEKQIVMLNNDPKGMLCFNNEQITMNRKKSVLCIFFDAKQKRYDMLSMGLGVNVHEIKTLYKELKKGYIKLVDNQNGGFLVKDYGQFKAIAQMTTGNSGLLHFEVLDTITNAETAQKRFVTAIASSFLLGGLTTLVSYVYNKINERAGTTLALENCSNKKLPIVLEDPRWQQDGVDIQDIVPWKLRPQTSCRIGLVDKYIFARAAVSLSFKLQGTNDRIAITIWWTRSKNSYSLSWIDNSLTKVKLADYVNKATEKKKFPSTVIRVDEAQSYQIWQFPILNPRTRMVDKFLNVLTNMGNAKYNAMTVKVYATTAPPNTKPRSSFQPKVYSGHPDQIPPTH